MKNTKPIKTFPIQFTKPIIGVAIAILSICITGIAVSLFQIIRFGMTGFNDMLKYPFLLLISVFCIILTVSILAKSKYIIQDGYFISKFGFIQSKVEIKQITSMLWDTDTNKLNVYLGEEFFVVAFAKDWIEDLVRELLKINPDISYSFTSGDEK